MDSNVKAMGDAIAALTLVEAVELSHYLESLGGEESVGALVPTSPPQPTLSESANPH